MIMHTTAATDSIIAAGYIMAAIMWVHFKYVVDGVRAVVTLQPWWDRL